VIIKVERSGGLTGISMSREVDVKDLPSELATIVRKKVVDTKSSSLRLKSTPRGAADYFTYRISVRDGANQKVIECNEYNIQKDLQVVIKYIESHSKKAK
jgi:Emfourin